MLASTAIPVNIYIERVKRILCLLNFQEVQIKRLTTEYIFRRPMTFGGLIDLLGYTIHYIHYIVQISAAYICLRNKTNNIYAVENNWLNPVFDHSSPVAPTNMRPAFSWAC